MRSIKKRNRRSHKKNTLQRRKKNTLKRTKKNSFKKNKKDKKRSNHKKTVTKKQKGGSLLASIGIGLAATAVTAAAYKGYRMISKLNDKGYMYRLLNQDYISYSPKVIVVETTDFMKHYLDCVSTVEFFQLLCTIQKSSTNTVNFYHFYMSKFLINVLIMNLLY